MCWAKSTFLQVWWPESYMIHSLDHFFGKKPCLHHWVRRTESQVRRTLYICVAATYEVISSHPPWHLLCPLRCCHCVFDTGYARSARPMPRQMPYCVFSCLMHTLRSLTPFVWSVLLCTQRSRSALSASTKQPCVLNRSLCASLCPIPVPASQR